MKGAQRVESALYNSSLANGLRVLEAFGNGRQSLSLTQLVSITDLEKSAVQRFTATLVRLRYLSKDPVTRQYSLAPRVLELGGHYTRASSLIERSTPYLIEWNRRYEETVNLCVLDDTDIIVIYRFRARHVASPGVVIGSRLPWHVTSIGQAIVAHSPEEQQKALLKRSNLVKHAARSITTRAAIAERLEWVKREGYALCFQESFDEDISIGAPVFDATGRVVAGVGIALVTGQWNVEDARVKLGPSVRELAKAISGGSQAARVSAR